MDDSDQKARMEMLEKKLEEQIKKLNNEKKKTTKKRKSDEEEKEGIPMEKNKKASEQSTIRRAFEKATTSTEVSTPTTDTTYGIGNETAGPCLTELEHFDIDNLAIITEKAGTKYATYSSDKRVYFRSAPYYGKLKIFYTKSSPSGSPNIVVKKSDVLMKFKDGLAKKLKGEVGFYGNPDSNYISPFIDTVLNFKHEKCVNAIHNGEEKLIPVTELDSMNVMMQAIIRSRSIKASSKYHDFAWGLSVSELILKPCPADYKPDEDVLIHSGQPRILFGQNL